MPSQGRVLGQHEIKDRASDSSLGVEGQVSLRLTQNVRLGKLLLFLDILCLTCKLRGVSWMFPRGPKNSTILSKFCFDTSFLLTKAHSLSFASAKEKCMVNSPAVPLSPVVLAEILGSNPHAVQK